MYLSSKTLKSDIMGLVNPGLAGGDWELISETVVSVAANAVTVSSISTGYKEIVIYVTGERSADSYANLRMNGDTGNNYAWNYNYDYDGNYSGDRLSAQSSIPIEQGADGNGAYCAIIWIMQDATINNRVKILGGGTTFHQYTTGTHATTTNVTSFTLTLNAAHTFSQNTRIIVTGRA